MGFDSAPDAKPLYVQLRKGRWFWEPPARLRKSNPELRARPLGADQVTAWAYARKLNKEFAGLDPDATQPGTVDWLFEQFFASDRFASLAASTQSDYRWLGKRLGKLTPGERPLGKLLARSIRPKHADKLYELLKTESGPSVAHYACRVARRVWKWGARREHVDSFPNPWAGMELASLPQREQRWTEAQVQAFRDECLVQGRASIALATMIAYCFGHREGDVLTLSWAQLAAGERRTGKTQTRAAVSAAGYPLLQVMLATELARQKDLDVRPTLVVVLEDTSIGWNATSFRHEVRRIARLAGIPDDLQFRDLRATALTELSDAGADIIDINTHGTHKTMQMTRRYVRPTVAQFDRAAAKRVAAKNKP